mgnify:CR=1 FL=1
MPDEAVKKAVAGRNFAFQGKVVIIAVGLYMPAGHSEMHKSYGIFVDKKRDARYIDEIKKLYVLL